MNAPAWAERALDRGLTAGRKVRIDHECGDGRTLMVSHDGSKIRGYCFRCKEPLFHELTLTLAERAALMSSRLQATTEAAASLDLPGEGAERLMHPHDWPAAARVWLYDAGLNDDIIREWGIYWLASMNRVVVPIEQWDGTDAWLARDVSPKPALKYLFPQGMRRNGGAHFCHSAVYDAIVVVEDVLSAYRISKAGDSAAIALLGTSADNALLLDLVREYREYGVQILTWLDPDQWGQRGARDIATRLGRYDVPVRNIVSGQDPKVYTDLIINQKISEVL